jgi:hypothetical protein
VWLQVHLAWERVLQPEEEDMQVYASWKYFRYKLVLVPSVMFNVQSRW